MALLVKNGKVLLETGFETLDVKMEGGLFTALGKDLVAGPDDEVLEAGGKFVLPGLMDSHVHYKLGLGHVYTVDNFETGSRAALFGGVTTIVDYADPVPGQSLTKALKARLFEARRASFTDYTMHMVVHPTDEVSLENFKELRDYGVNSVKLFTTYPQRLSYERMEAIMAVCKELDMVVTVHAEDHDLVTQATADLKAAGKTEPAYHAQSRPGQAEVLAVKKMIELSKKTGAHVHIVHVSVGEAGQLIGAAQKDGVRITAETCPHYLELDDSAYEKDDAQLYIMQPPLREAASKEILWQEVLAGTFSFFTTDHCAYALGQKMVADTFYETNGGIPGTETLFPLLHTCGVGTGRMTLKELVDMLSIQPAKTFGLYPQKGTIRLGSDADLVIFDPKKKETIRKDLIHSAAQYSPFEGRELEGYPETTILRGRVMCHQGRFLAGDPQGVFVKA